MRHETSRKGKTSTKYYENIKKREGQKVKRSNDNQKNDKTSAAPEFV